MNNLEAKRTQESVMDELRSGNFMTLPGDVFTVNHCSGVISSSIIITISNPIDNTVRIALPNKIDSWKLLKQLNDMGGRKVLYQIDDAEPIPFEKSTPYRYRFDPFYKRNYKH